MGKDKKERVNLIELYKNKRYRALIHLGLYAIFFIFVFILIGSNQDVDVRPNTNANTNNDIEINNNYSYYYKFNITKKDTTNIITYEGGINKTDNLGIKNSNSNKEEFYIKDDKVYLLGIMDSKWHLQDEEYNIYEDIDDTFIDYNNIKNLIKSSELISTETIHKDQTEAKTYELSLNKAIDLYQNINSLEAVIPSDLEDVITIKRYMKNNLPVKIELDISSLINYYDALVDEYLVILNYSNIGNVSEFNINIEDN